MRELSIQYKLSFKSYHLKYFNLGVCVFLSKLKSALGKRGLVFFDLTRAPKRRNHFTVIKSPFAQKSSREQFKVENFKLGLKLPFAVPLSKAAMFEKLLEDIFNGVNLQNFVSVTFKKSYISCSQLEEVKEGELVVERPWLKNLLSWKGLES